jgi:MarR family transcriptional regulator for hemolysin
MQETGQSGAEFAAWLGLLPRAWRKRADSKLAGCGVSEAAAWPLISVFRAGGGMRQVALAEMLGIEGSSLVRLLDQLCLLGLLERREDASDRRAKTLHLTRSGKTLARRIEAILAGLRAELLAEIPPAELAACLAVMRRVGDRLDCAVLRPLPEEAPLPQETT